MRKKAGFTLTELVVIIVILGILTVVGVTNFLSWLPKYHLKSAVRDLYSNMQLAKMAAIRANGNCSVTYSSSPDQYAVSLLNKTVVLGDYGSGVNFDGPNNETFAVATITFNPRGTSNSGYAYLSNSGETAYYRVGPLTSGVINLQKWGGGSWE